MIKYPLTDKEYSIINKVWAFIQIFNKPYIYITDYRNYLIKKIRKRYTLEEFYLYESIANKLYWNLRWLLFPLFLNPNMTKHEYDNFNFNKYTEIPDSLTKCKKMKYYDPDDLDKKLKDGDLYNDNYYRSFINKLIIIDQQNKTIYHKLMEGSANIFNKNNFNLVTWTILMDENLYNKIIDDPYNIKKLNIELPVYYHQQDYGFPNLNFCVYSFGSAEDHIDRIDKMYYKNKNGKFWFKLIL